MICLSPRTVLEGTVCGYHLLDWRSFKLPRVARSTLAAEGQAASEAADCLHFAVVFWKAMLDPEFRISEVKPETHRWWSPCALIVDAKCLYDLLHREELYVSTAADKRTCLEALTTRDKLREIGGEARWVSSERQYADGLTKDSATQLLADRLRTHMHKIVADDTYQASRKKTAVDRQRSAQQFAQPKAGWTGRAAAFAAAALTVASQPAPTEAHRDDDVSGALTYYMPQTYSDYSEAGYYIFLPILVIIFFIYVHPTSAIQRLITFTWWTRATRITIDAATQTEDTASATTFTETRNRWCQTDSALLHSPVQTAEGLALDLQLVRAYNQRLAAAVHRQQEALNYHTEYRLEHHHIGDLYVTPHAVPGTAARIAPAAVPPTMFGSCPRARTAQVHGSRFPSTCGTTRATTLCQRLLRLQRPHRLRQQCLPFRARPEDHKEEPLHPRFLFYHDHHEPFFYMLPNALGILG